VLLTFLAPLAHEMIWLKVCLNI